ncbi:uncharacterized protein B0T15DRAFT_563241 [Chaetomium strumarium]|uniref:DUF8212 domain-containing protein n=1 Tax=Chaetomium strumarium TaxID=1170767 RepID=A0AAJ0GKR3_9PEZI|nr:hypothetical protein B0T15DRAFT_563241 [Chaetomium strumarium]
MWIDTCCIDKSSSAELSEAINSMYRWYVRSRACYAYLSDVTDVEHLGNSRWFTRGWTLQELIAPHNVEFYGSGWEYLGKKSDPSLRSILSQASPVDECVLDDKAFIRLQQEIVRTTDDQSILAWYCYEDSDTASICPSESCLAPSPRCFAMSGEISLFRPEPPRGTLVPSIYVNGRHVEVSAVITSSKSDTNKIKSQILSEIEVILNCQIGPVTWTFATLRLWKSNEMSGSRALDQGIVTRRTLYRPERLFGHSCVEVDDLDLTWYWNQPHHNSYELDILPKAADHDARRFSVQRVTIQGTGFKTRSTRHLSNGSWLYCDELLNAWLMPLSRNAAEITVSQWFGLWPAQWPRRPELTSSVPLIYGAIRVNLLRTGSDVNSRHANLGTAIVIFGLVLGPGAHWSLLQDPWCSLFKDDGVSSLEHYLASEMTLDEARRDASLEIGPETVLKAFIVPVKVSGHEYGLIRLWVDK